MAQMGGMTELASGAPEVGLATASPIETQRASRRAEIDWLRVIAFGLLIFFHVGLAFSPWTWHINTDRPEYWLPPLLEALNPWRLTLLFLISGAAVGLMRKTNGALGLVMDRSRRILPPLFLGVIFLVPPQAYAQWADGGAYAGSLRDFISDYVKQAMAHGIPTNHLWFLVFIYVYGLIAALLFGFAPQVLSAMRAGAERVMRGPMLVLLPMFYCVMMRLTLFPFFGVTNSVTHDWYNHSVSLAAFLLGFAIARSENVWDEFARMRFLSLRLALIGFIGIQMFHGMAYWREIAFGVAQWGGVASIVGFARRYLAHAHSPLLRYLAGGVLSFYVLHQTITVLAIFWLKPLNLPDIVFAPLVIGITVGGCWAGYELIRRSPLLCKLFSATPKTAASTV
jgi:hypothetical protein